MKESGATETTKEKVETLDEQNFKFIQNNYSRHLQCPLCHKLMIRPMRIHPCAHTFCHSCLTNFNELSSSVSSGTQLTKSKGKRSDKKRLTQSCPFDSCSSKMIEIQEDRTAQSLIDELKVKCNNQGCLWKGTFEKYKKQHMKACSLKGGFDKWLEEMSRGVKSQQNPPNENLSLHKQNPQVHKQSEESVHSDKLPESETFKNCEIVGKENSQLQNIEKKQAFSAASKVKKVSHQQIRQPPMKFSNNGPQANVSKDLYFCKRSRSNLSEDSNQSRSRSKKSKSSGRSNSVISFKSKQSKKANTNTVEIVSSSLANERSNSQDPLQNHRTVNRDFNLLNRQNPFFNIDSIFQQERKRLEAVEAEKRQKMLQKQLKKLN